MVNIKIEDLLMPIEINVAMALVIVEVFVLMLIVILVLFIRVRKYGPHYRGNVMPGMYVRRYLTRIIQLTKKYATKISDDAKEGKIKATKRRQNMVARLNWLILERDFIIEKQTDRMYWEDLNSRITRMLETWTEVEFIDTLPDEDLIAATLSENPKDSVRALNRTPIDDGKDEIIAKLEERAHYLEKQVRNLGSYKNLYLGLEKSYSDLQASYKNLKQTMQSLQLSEEDKARLEQLIKEHENAEKTMESQMKEMESAQERLNAELSQLETAFLKLEQESREASSKVSATLSSDDAANLGSIIKGEMGEGESLQAQNALDKRDNMMRELRGSVLALNLDTDTKISVEEKMNDLEKANEEVKVVINLLEMERNRLQQEIETVKNGSPSAS